MQLIKGNLICSLVGLILMYDMQNMSVPAEVPHQDPVGEETGAWHFSQKLTSVVAARADPKKPSNTNKQMAIVRTVIFLNSNMN